MKMYLAVLIPLLTLSFLVSGASAAQDPNIGTHPVLATKIVKVNKEFVIV